MKKEREEEEEEEGDHERKGENPRDDNLMHNLGEPDDNLMLINFVYMSIFINKLSMQWTLHSKLLGPLDGMLYFYIWTL
jgi:hypothetical protein